MSNINISSQELPDNLPITSDIKQDGQSTSKRPYRSKRLRPCDYCRRRKMRCELIDENICVRCKKNGEVCTFLVEPIKRKRPATSSNSNSTPIKVKSIKSDSILNSNPSPLPTGGSIIEVPPLEPPPPPQIEALMEENQPPLIPDGYHSATLMGLSGDQDPYLLQYYNYNSKDDAYSFIKHAIRRVSDNQSFPIQFLAFNDERGHTVEDERAAQLDKIDKLAGKFEEQLLALYFRFVHPTYPIVDKVIFYRDYYYSKKSINPGLLAGLLALSCVWWKYDAILCVNSIPPGLSEELYSECLKAVDRDIKYPNLSTVQALLLLLQKRLLMDQTAETYAVYIDVSKLIAVAHNLGLHIDCSNWNIPPSTKRLRKKLWATIYIMEKWTSINLGRPSLLHDSNSTHSLYDSDDINEQLFVHLGSLTSILDSVVQQLYSVRYQDDQYFNTAETQRKVDNLFNTLEIWRNNLPSDVKDMQCALPGQFCKNGTLHLAALTVEILLHRIRLRPIASNLPQYTEYRLKASETIQKIIQFTLEITHSHLHAFWYSMTRLNFSTIAHFVFYFHLTSPTSQEYSETRDTLRKWLFALRVLSQGWEEGTGLATLRMDTVFWMGKDLFSQADGNNNGNNNISSNDGNTNNSSSNNGNNDNTHLPPNSRDPTPTQSLEPPPLPVTWISDQVIEPYHENMNDPHEHPEFGEEVDNMLFLNEDIMPQNEQVDNFLGQEVPDDANAYSEYFDNDSNEGMLTGRELHELLAVPDELFTADFGLSKDIESLDEDHHDHQYHHFQDATMNQHHHQHPQHQHSLHQHHLL